MNIQCFFSISKHITLIGKPFITLIHVIESKFNIVITVFKTCRRHLPLDWYLDEVLLAIPKKDGWGGLADGPRAR